MLATLVTTASAIVVLPRSVCNGVPGPEPSGRLPALRVATAALGLLVVCSAIDSSIRKVACSTTLDCAHREKFCAARDPRHSRTTPRSWISIRSPADGLRAPGGDALVLVT